MQYKDIKLGEAYYHDRGTKWQQYRTGEKVIIDDLTRYNPTHWRPVQSPTGQYLYGHTPGHSKTLYRMAALRGPWDEIAPRQEAIQVEQLAGEQKQREERRAVKARIEAAIMALGIKYDSYFIRGSRYEMAIEDLEDLVARLEPTA